MSLFRDLLLGITTIKQLEVSSIFDIRCSILEIQIEKLVRYSRFEIQIEKLVRFSRFKLVIRTVTAFMLLSSKHFLGIQKITEYHVFNFKTGF